LPLLLSPRSQVVPPLLVSHGAGGPTRLARASLRGLLIGLALTGCCTLGAHAAEIEVARGCTLVDAVAAADTATATGGCPKGDGADILVLDSDVTLTTVNNTVDGANGLPSIISDITINGNGYTIERDAALACPAGGTADFRIFQVAANGTLTLNE